MVTTELQRLRVAKPSRLPGERNPSRPRAMPNRRTTVLVVDDHAIVCEGLISLLASHSWLVVVGQASDGQEALIKARQLQPDLVVVDINLPKLNGLALIKALHTDAPQIKTIIFSMHSPEEFAWPSVESGVQGYICKRAASTELVKALETVASGGMFFSSGRTLDRRSDSKTAITPRQREVLVGVAEGLSNKEIAARLGLGVRTVETHRQRLGRKLNIRSAASLTRFAVEQGLLAA